MPSVLAIISKAIFDKMAPKGVDVGALVEVDRYVSKNKAFDSLAQGGAMFLVTVRPPDERLWLVAIVNRPRQAGDAWVGEPNRTPIADVTSAIPELAFSTGQGLKVKKGVLGMSLQTPRVLTDADDRLLRGLATGGPPASPPAPEAPAPTKRSPTAPERASVARMELPAMAGDRQAVVERLLARWRELPAVELAEAIEKLAPLAALDEVTTGTAAEALARAVAFERWPADPRIASAVLAWIFAFPFHATSSQPFWRLAFRLLEASADPRAIPLLDEKRLPECGLTMLGWMQKQIVAVRTALQARFPGGPPTLSPADARALKELVAGALQLPSPAPARSTPGGDEPSLLRAVYEHPEDDGPRAVYADWLLERQDPRGEFITLQLARGRRPPTGPEWTREMKLLSKHFRPWLGDLVTATGVKAYSVGVRPDAHERFERGFLVSTRLGGSEATLRKIVGNPTLATLERVRLGDHLDADLAAALVLDPVVRSLVALTAPFGLVERLPGTPLGDRLRELSVDARQAGQAVAVVAVARRLPRLTRLRMDASGGYMGRGGTRITASPTSADLEAAAQALAIERLRRLEFMVTGALAVLRREGKGWTLGLSTWDENGPLAGLLEALARSPIRRLVNANSTSVSYRDRKEIARNKPPLPALVSRVFPGLEIEVSRESEEPGESEEEDEEG